MNAGDCDEDLRSEVGHSWSTENTHALEVLHVYYTTHTTYCIYTAVENNNSILVTPQSFDTVKVICNHIREMYFLQLHQHCAPFTIVGNNSSNSTSERGVLSRKKFLTVIPDTVGLRFSIGIRCMNVKKKDFNSVFLVL